MTVVFLPLIGLVVGSTVLWDAVDRGFMGRPLDGILMSLVRWINRVTTPINKHFVKHESDSFLVNVLLNLGVALPLLFMYNAYQFSLHGLSLRMVFLYHMYRLGPYFMNFAYVYTLCHKEGHSRNGMFKGVWNGMLKNAFNWWIGLFYGVLPSSFAYGHSINHHRYNNGPKDVISTADMPRDNLKAFISFIPRFALYSLNVSTVIQFNQDGHPDVAVKMLFGSLYFIAWVVFWAFLTSPMFVFAYLIFPLGENIVLLSCVQWAWHSFIDPIDPEDEYVGSVTIFDGPINVLGEDYHVVHHQYPGQHWEDNEKQFKKHFALGEYQKVFASAFRNTHTFEIFGMVVARDYKALAEKFVDFSEKMTSEEKVELMKVRLRSCWWGPRQNSGVQLKGKEVGNHDLGFEVPKETIKNK